MSEAVIQRFKEGDGDITNNNEEQEVIQNNTIENELKSNSTYIEITPERDEVGHPLSILEVDLVISREKGVEKRRLKMNFTSIDVEKQQLVEKSVSLDRENFELLKKFFCNLDWNS